MELYSIDSELRFLKTVTNAKIPKRDRLTFLGKVTVNTFHHEYTQQAYTRILSLLQSRNHLIDWSELKTDPSMERDARDLFEDTDVKAAKSSKSLDKLILDLEEFRKRRMLFDIINDVASEFEKDEKIVADSLLDTLRNGIGSIQENMVEDETVWSFGENDNSEDILDRILHKPGETLYKTGFDEYDNRNGGLPTNGVMIMAATTSGGKSAVSMNLEKNLAELNKGMHACKVTLEMSEEQEGKRVASMVSGVPLAKFKHNNLTDREKKTVMKKMKKWREKLKENKSRFTFVSGKKSRTIDQLLAFLIPYAFKVIIIDYISLLEGVDDDNQWRMLSAIARKCKVFSAEHNCLVVLLAQLDTESSQLRYSKGIKEHADVMWKWNYYDEEVRATHVITIEVDKARDGELFHMPVGEDFATMRISNPSDEDLESYEELKNSKNRRGKGKKSSDDDDDTDTELNTRRRKRSRNTEDDEDESEKRAKKKSRRKREGNSLVL